MTDEKFVMMEDIKERSVTARSSHHMGGNKGTKCKTPSDYLSNSKREKLNGNISTYKLGSPITYKELLSYPIDIQKQYCEGILEKYNIPLSNLIRALGGNYSSVKSHLMNIGLRSPHNNGYKGNASDIEAFEKFWYLSSMEEKELNPISDSKVSPESPADDIQKFIDIIKQVKKLGATIEINIKF